MMANGIWRVRRKRAALPEDSGVLTFRPIVAIYSIAMALDQRLEISRSTAPKQICCRLQVDLS